MKKILCICALFIALTSCNGNSTNNNTDEVKSNDNGSDTYPIDSDTTKPGTGMDNAEVISTDTAAMNVQRSIDKAKDASKKK